MCVCSSEGVVSEPGSEALRLGAQALELDCLYWPLLCDPGQLAWLP